MCALWCNSHAHCVTISVILSVLMLSEPCAIIIFGLQLVSSRVDWNRSKLILDKCYFFIFTCFSSVPFHCIPRFFPGKGWQLTCVQHTRRLTRVQHTKYYSHASYYHAAYKVWIMYSTQNIACTQYTRVDLCTAHCVSHVSFD